MIAEISVLQVSVVFMCIFVSVCVCVFAENWNASRMWDPSVVARKHMPWHFKLYRLKPDTVFLKKK